jgi:hypothetical protein
MRRAFLLTFALAATGCAPRSMLMVDVFMAGYAAGQASTQPPVETPLDEDPPLDRVEYVSTTPTDVDLQRAASPRALRPFDSSAAYASIARADLASCKPEAALRATHVTPFSGTTPVTVHRAIFVS